MTKQRRQEYQKAEQYVRESFGTESSSWGIDKVAVGNVGIGSIDIEQLMMKNYALPDKRCKVTEEPDDKSINGIASIRISQAGYNLYIGRNAVGIYAIIDLVSEGNNIRTRDIKAVKSHLQNVKDNVLREFGIELIIDAASVRSIEIAYTTISDRIPIYSRYLIMQSFYKRGRCVEFDKTSKTKASDLYGEDISYILVKNKRAVKTGASYVFYDKTREMIDKKELLELPVSNSRIYRFEAKLSATSVKACLGTNKLEELTDDAVLQYVYVLINDIADYYRRLFLKSANTAKIRLQKLFCNPEKKRKSLKDVLKDVIDIEGDVVKSEKMPIIDQESILYSSTGGVHGTRPIWQYLDNVHGSYLTEMYGWVTEDVINDMLDTYHYSMAEGLGCHPGNADNIEVNHFCYDCVDEDELKEYFRYLIQKTKPRYAYMYRMVHPDATS